MLAEILQPTLDEIEASAHCGVIVGASTGFIDVDTLFNGGCRAA